MIDEDEKFYIGTTRFTTSTYAENKEWRDKHNWRGCIYGLNKKMPKTVPYMALVYVIEMNNDTNEIMGIGSVSYTHLRAHETKANLVCRREL